MTTPERLAADLAHVGLQQAEAAVRGDWDAVRRFDDVRRQILSALGASCVSDSRSVRDSLAAAHAAAAQVEQAVRFARPAMTAELRRAQFGDAAGRAYGAAGAY